MDHDQHSTSTCQCELITGAFKSIPVSAWDSFENETDSRQRSKPGITSQGRRQTKITRYGYETVEDKYKFKHYDDISRYIEEYSSLFSAVYRISKKIGKPNPPQYRLISQQAINTNEKKKGTSSYGFKKFNLAVQTEEDQESKGENSMVHSSVSGAKITRDCKASTFQSTLRAPVGHMTAAPPLNPYNGNLDDIDDESEDDQPNTQPQTNENPGNTPKVPLLKQLNTFFFSKNGRRRTTYNTPLFPMIANSDDNKLVGVTPASLINYRLPAGGANSRPVTNPQPNRHPLFLCMHDRQHTLGAAPIKMKMAHSGEADHSRWTTLRKYNLYSQRKEEERQLPSSHVLEAKTIPTIHTSKACEEQPAREKTATSMIKQESKDNSKAIQILPSSRQSIHKSIHNLLSNYNRFDNISDLASSDSAKSRFGRAELVDYTDVYPASY